MDTSKRWGDHEGAADVVRGARGSSPSGRRVRPSRTSRRGLCEAHRRPTPAVATINVGDADATWEVAVCAHHLAILEAELGGWSRAS